MNVLLKEALGADEFKSSHTSYEKYDKEMICPYKKGKDISIMI
jgi:hypothetical protein